MNQQPHRIRLTGFWQELESSDGRVRLCRSFGRPRSLDPDERVWLVCEPSVEPNVVTVNGQKIIGQLTEVGSEFAITEVLQPRNQVILDTRTKNPTVVLEIRRNSQNCKAPN